MDRTLFTPAMIETFSACRRAYKIAYGKGGRGAHPSALAKRFLLKALADINRGRITTVSQLQKFIGHHWPADAFSAEDGVKAFLFAYKAITQYLCQPYKPEGAAVVGVSWQVRARVPYQRTYLEDSFDLILWHRDKLKLELVDYHIGPLKAVNPAWPSATLLVKQFLAARLRSRWHFDQLDVTFVRVGSTRCEPRTISLDDRLYRLHWPQILKTIDEMKIDADYPHCSGNQCRRCQLIDRERLAGVVEEPANLYRTS